MHPEMNRRMGGTVWKSKACWTWNSGTMAES